MEERTKHSVLMVSDFFYPNFGGVENHIYYLSQCLLKLGHKVVVMTHAYGNRTGVRYMTGGLKVYYIPWRPFLMQNTLPTIFGTLPIVRTILIRERVSIVHGHQAFSTLCHEALMHARTMGYKVVFTDHSLYGFADVGSIHMNKVLQFTLADVSQAICVSHTSKENTVLRSGLPPEKVFVIPNAVDTAMFKPATEKLGIKEIIIVVISRLVYRKGADLLVEVIPEVCRIFPNVRFIVGGDGPKRVRLEEMREKHSLQDRVEMLGAVAHAQVRSVLVSGHIFLNSSLTEAFCIAILEAASCGLLTVSTRVGGVPEVLPDDMVVLAEPDPGDMVRAIAKAITILPKIDPKVMHLRMKNLYSWPDVAMRTQIVYDRALQCPSQNLLDRLSRYLSCGAWAGKLFCLVMIIDFLLWHLLKLWQNILGSKTVEFDQLNTSISLLNTTPTTCSIASSSSSTYKPFFNFNKLSSSLITSRSSPLSFTFTKPLKAFNNGSNSTNSSSSIRAHPISSSYTTPEKTQKNPILRNLNKAVRVMILTAVTVGMVGKFSSLQVRAEAPAMVMTEESESLAEDVKNDVESSSPLSEFIGSNVEALDALKSLLKQRLENGEDEDALKILNRLVSAQPESVEFKFLSARLLNEMGKFDDARNMFEEILKLNPLSFEALCENAVLMDRCGQGQAAIMRLGEALKIAEDETKVKDVRGVKLIMAQIQFLQKNVDEALKGYEELEKEDPSDYRPYFCKGMIFSLLDQNEEAKEQFAKYKALSPIKYDVEGFLQTPLSRMKLFGNDDEILKS